MPESAAWSSPVLASVLPVVWASRHVTTDTDAVERTAEWLAAEELGWPPAVQPLDAGADPDLVTDFLMVANSINFAFTDFATGARFEADRDGRRWSDSEGMTACLRNALDAGVPVLDGAWMADATAADVDAVFAGTITMPLLQERTAILNGIGRVLVERYGGRWRSWVADCAPAMYADGDGLLERLTAEFPRYRDVSPYDGAEVQVHKLGQLGLWTLHTTGTAASPKAPGGRLALADLDRMTAFADYIVPVALRAMHILEYTPELDARIAAGVELPRDSEEEIEIRAHTLYATAALTDAVNRRRPADAQLVIPQLDWRLWSHYHATHLPHHLTRTVMY